MWLLLVLKSGDSPLPQKNPRKNPRNFLGSQILIHKAGFFDAAELRTSPFRCVNLIWHGFHPQPSWVEGLLDPYMAGPKTFMKLMGFWGPKWGPTSDAFYEKLHSILSSPRGGFRPHVVSWRSRDMGCPSSPLAGRKRSESKKSGVFFKDKTRVNSQKRNNVYRQQTELW